MNHAMMFSILTDLPDDDPGQTAVAYIVQLILKGQGIFIGDKPGGIGRIRIVIVEIGSAVKIVVVVMPASAAFAEPGAHGNIGCLFFPAYSR